MYIKKLIRLFANKQQEYGLQKNLKNDILLIKELYFELKFKLSLKC